MFQTVVKHSSYVRILGKCVKLACSLCLIYRGRKLDYSV